jgi:hypothetical protein
MGPVQPTLDPALDRFFTLLGSVQDGDLRPLADAILEGQPIDPLILTQLALMINEGKIGKGQQRHRGRPKQRAKSFNDAMAARFYNKFRQTLSSADAFRRTANILKTTEATVRKAVTARRNSEK